MLVGKQRVTNRCSEWGKLSLCLRVFRQCPPWVLPSRLLCSSSDNLSGLISSVCGKGRAMEAFKLLSTRNVKESPCNLDIYIKVLDSLVMSGHIPQAFDLFRQMKVDFPSNQGLYVTMLRVLCKAGRMDFACQHLAEMGSLRFAPGARAVNDLVNDFCKAGKWKSCHQLLVTLCDVGFMPTLFTFNAFFGFLCRAGLMHQACKLLDDIVKLGFTLDVYTYSIMIHTLCKADKVDEAYKLLKAMRNKKCEPDVVCYSTLLHGYVRLGKQELAMKIMDEMRRNDCSPDVVTYNSLISMFSKLGNMTKAYEVWDQMRVNDCVPDKFSYTAMLDGFCRQNQAKECLKLVLQMLKKRLMPSASLQRKLQECLERHGVDNDMQKVLQEIRSNGVDLLLPNSIWH